MPVIRGYGYTKSGLPKLPARKKRRVRKVTTKAISRICKKIIARDVENKQAQYYDAIADIYPVTHAGFVNSVIPLTPYASYLAISQGTGESDRVGNRLKIKRIMFKGIILPTAYNVTSNPVPRPSEIIMWIYHSRDDPTTLTAPDNSFLELNNGSQALSGNLFDTIAPVNNDKWVLHKRKVFKIGFAEYGGTGTTASQQSFANNDFKYNRKFSINVTKYAVKHVKYNDNTTTPSTRGVFCVMQAVSATGGGYTSAYIPAEMSYTLTMEYEDA